jgi:hypothetical protein
MSSFKKKMPLRSGLLLKLDDEPDDEPIKVPPKRMMTSLDDEPVELPPKKSSRLLSLDLNLDDDSIKMPASDSRELGSPIHFENNSELIPEHIMESYIKTANINNHFILDKMIEIRNNVEASDRLQTKNKIIEHVLACPDPLIHGKRNFENLVGESITPEYVSYVCMIHNRIFKLVNCQAHYMSDFSMMKELAFQYYAKHLSEDHRKCNFKVPEIISYGRLALTNPYEHNEILKSEKYKIYGPYNCFWFIEMEKMSYGTLNNYLEYVNLNNQEICDALSEKLIELDTCLKKNDLHHNDYHGDNVFYNPDNGEIGLIDYGISNFEGILGTNSGVDYTCDTLKEIQKNLKKKDFEQKHIGGKKYRTKKYKSRKYRTKKYKSRKYKSRTRNRNRTKKYKSRTKKYN